jgi:L-ribulose-5-phosphate 4-epimerase
VSHEALKEEVCRANLALVEARLVVITWGNVSGIDRADGVVAIKPSGVSYDVLKPADIVLVSLESGDVIEGDMRPSSDTPTHLLLYRWFDSIGGIVHTHSSYATSWAQAGRAIPCLGTTHADHFYGPVPVTRQLTPDEIEDEYEANAGRVIMELFEHGGLDPVQMPAALLPGHGPFVWGATADKAVENAIVLEETAKMAFRTLMIHPGADGLPQKLLDKHFLRKHGPGAYYGQEK